jgi:formylglycine-generating enzyme required for sulfatase activity
VPEGFKYAAFISYSSRDAAFAKRLHRALEGYGIPNALGDFRILGQSGKRNRIYPVFRDREELPAGDLSEQIRSALAESRSLIVVCSPYAAESVWVEKEIETFIQLGRRDRVFAVIADDAPLSAPDGGDGTRLSFPAALRGGESPNAAALELVAADARPSKDGFRNAWLKLVAGMIGINAGALQDRDRRRRQARMIQNGVVGALIFACVGTAYAFRQPLTRSAYECAFYRPFVEGAPKSTFQDCRRNSTDCPVMVVIPGGQFMMGSPDDDVYAGEEEHPLHRVSIESFAASKYDITFDDWAACVRGGGCSTQPDPSDRGWGRGRRPVINVNWDDAQEYATWLSQMTGKQYRLLTEAEWEYAARAGTTTEYYWGDEAGLGRANFGGSETLPGGSFPPNAFGLFDMAGNVDQWVEDCEQDNYFGTPTDGRAFQTADCTSRVLRGGAFGSDPNSGTDQSGRSASRRGLQELTRFNFIGFRVARTLQNPPRLGSASPVSADDAISACRNTGTLVYEGFQGDMKQAYSSLLRAEAICRSASNQLRRTPLAGRDNAALEMSMDQMASGLAETANATQIPTDSPVLAKTARQEAQAGMRAYQAGLKAIGQAER